MDVRDFSDKLADALGALLVTALVLSLVSALIGVSVYAWVGTLKELHRCVG